MNEEKEHAAMLMEWIRENDPVQDGAFKKHDQEVTYMPFGKRSGGSGSGRGAGQGAGRGQSGGGGGGQGGGRGGGGRGGGGGGRMGGTRAGAGPGGNCLCPNCGKTVPHSPGIPCYTLNCPGCGTAMIRE